MRHLLTLLTALFLAASIGSCTRTVYEPVEVVRTEYVKADTTGLYERLRSYFESIYPRETSTDSGSMESKNTRIGTVSNKKGRKSSRISDLDICLKIFHKDTKKMSSWKQNIYQFIKRVLVRRIGSLFQMKKERMNIRIKWNLIHMRDNLPQIWILLEKISST